MAERTYADWHAELTEEAKAAYVVLLASGRCVACHFALKPGLFGGHPVEVLPDDTPLLNGHAKARRPFRRKAAAALAVAEVDAMQTMKKDKKVHKGGKTGKGEKDMPMHKEMHGEKKKPAKKAKK